MTPDTLRSRYGIGPHDLARVPGDLADLVRALRLVAGSKTTAIAQAMGTTQRTLCRLRSKVMPSLTTKNERSDHNPNQPIPGIQRPVKRTKNMQVTIMTTTPITPMRLVCGLLLARPFSPSEIAKELHWTVPEAQDALEQAVAEGWALRTSGLGKAVRYRATHRPPYCQGGWVPPGPGDRKMDQPKSGGRKLAEAV